jgi:RNA polymerase sigma factor (TIGR02999 family)
MPATRNPETVARLMANFRQGDAEAAAGLMELFYPELRRMAGARMRAERVEHTWQPTALVNELYLELVKIKALRPPDAGGEEEREAFLALAGHIMKRLLIHHARPLYKRAEKTELAEFPDLRAGGVDSLAQIDSALERLAALNPKLRSVVELRVFEGLTGEEIAARMDCAPRTVARYWTFAQQWLSEEFGRVPSSERRELA